MPTWWRRLVNDPSVYIDIRKDNNINVYFEGGSVANIHYCTKHKRLQVLTHHKYLDMPSSQLAYVECSDVIDNKIDLIKDRIKENYSQKHSKNGIIAKENWSEKYIQGMLVLGSPEQHLDSEFAYKDVDTDIRIDLVNVQNGFLTFIEIKRLDDNRMLNSTEDNPEVITQMRQYQKFLSERRSDLLEYYQQLYKIKQELGLKVPSTFPVEIDVIPQLLIVNRWEKEHYKRRQHLERVISILNREGIRYEIKSEIE